MSTLRQEASLAGGVWQKREPIEAATWACGYCGDIVSCNQGYFATKTPGTSERVAYVRLCPSCDGATYFTRSGNHYPIAPPGLVVSNVPTELAQLYDEARLSAGAGASTAAVLVCRKILMHIAVEEGAKEGQSFLKYVEYLADKGFVPPNGKVWVDYIRQRGNEANHEIIAMNDGDAKALITFVEMLLRFIYEFPSIVPQPPDAASASNS